MNRESMKEFLEKSFHDQHFSRAENTVFQELLVDWNPNQQDLAWLRNEIFAIASDAVKDSRDGAIIKWMHSLSKAMASKQSPAKTASKDEVLFFPSENGIHRLLGLLKAAKNSLDICVFTVTDNRISKEILAAHKRGVKVRLISDDDKSFDRGADTISLLQDGVPTRFDKTENHMHHKFAIVDQEILINGSFNWTRSASKYNHENLTISYQTPLLPKFQEEFENLWKEFE